MVPCDHFQTLLWEDQFGLLEASEREGLRQHLAACSACQSERVKAETGYLRLARASRLDVVVPLLKAPDPDFVPVILARAPRQREARRWGSRPWMAAAAAVLLAVGVLYGIYYQGLAGREAAFLKAEAAVKDVVAQRADARQQAENDVRALVAHHQATNLRVQVLGPAAYERAEQNQYRVLATSLAGTPADVAVTARLVDPSGRTLGDVRKGSGSGEFLLTFGRLAVDPSLKAARLEIEAQGLDQDVKLQTRIPILGSTYVTHLAVDKQLYRPGERIFFRSVTLKRSDLKPPGQSLTVTYTLQGPDGKLRESKSGQTRPEDGIGTWVFPLPADCPEGEYALTVAEAKNRFSAVRRQLQVRRSFPKEQTPAGKAIDQLYVEFFPEGGDLVWDMPCRIYFRARDGRGQPVDLAGSIVDSKGQEVVSLRTSGPGQGSFSRGLGVFTLPLLPLNAARPLKLHITSPAGIAAAADLAMAGSRRPGANGSARTKTTQGTQPLEIVIPELRRNSAGLSVATPVTRTDEPLSLTILCKSDYPLVVGVFCRGRLVAEQVVRPKSGSGRSEVRLTPPQDAHGILRVTLFQAGGNQLIPIAERLVYRHPAKPLNLSLAAEKERYSPGQKIRLLIRSTKEKEDTEKSWLLVSVVNQAALTQAGVAKQGLPAYFYLGTELEQAADLDGADLLVSDDPQAAEALDLFLGTQGWRRFVEPDPGMLLAKNGTGASIAAASEAAMGLLKLDNLEDVERRYRAEVKKGVAGLHAALAVQNGELTAEGERRQEEARQAAQALDDYRVRTAEYIRLGIGSGTLATLTTGCILLSLAAVRLVRRRTANRPYLAGAFMALLICLITYNVPSHSSEARGQISELRKVDLLKAALQDVGWDQQMLNLAQLEAPVFPELWFARFDLGKRRVEQASALAYRPDQAFAEQDRGVIAQIQKGKPEDFKRPPFIGAIVPRPQGPGPFPLPVREYAYDLKKPLPPAHPTMPTTLLWKPVLISAADGTVRVEFDLPKNAATYRVRVEGHTSGGRLGSLQRVLEVRQNDVNPAK